MSSIWGDKRSRERSAIVCRGQRVAEYVYCGLHDPLNFDLDKTYVVRETSKSAISLVSLKF